MLFRWILWGCLLMENLPLIMTLFRKWQGTHAAFLFANNEIKDKWIGKIELKIDRLAIISGYMMLCYLIIVVCVLSLCMTLWYTKNFRLLLQMKRQQIFLIVCRCSAYQLLHMYYQHVSIVKHCGAQKFHGETKGFVRKEKLSSVYLIH